MGLILSSAPAVEPLTTAEAKAHLRVDHSLHDTHIDNLIKSARESCENFQNRAYITQTWILYLDDFPASSCAIYLPLPPLQSVTSITYYDTNGVQQTLASTKYQVDNKSPVGRVLPTAVETWPATETGRVNSVAITYVCGYGNTAASIPANIMQAIRLTLSDFYHYPENVVVGNIVNEIPVNARHLLWQNRIYQF